MLRCYSKFRPPSAPDLCLVARIVHLVLSAKAVTTSSSIILQEVYHFNSSLLVVISQSSSRRSTTSIRAFLLGFSTSATWSSPSSSSCPRFDPASCRKAASRFYFLIFASCSYSLHCIRLRASWSSTWVSVLGSRSSSGIGVGDRSMTPSFCRPAV